MSSSMRFGLFIVATDFSANPVELGRHAEACGFESLFVPEHSHIPVRQETDFPFGGAVPVDHKHIYDPFVVLAAVAASTERLLVATGVCLVLERHPLMLAKQVATLDHLSGGRLLLGVGSGWNREELRNHGIDPSRRMGAFREHLEAAKAVWEGDEAEYHGEFVNFDPVWSWPKPLQRPHPPILVGGNHSNVIERVLTFGDEWLPNVGRMGEDELREAMETLARLAGDRGRAVPAVTAFRAQPDRAAVERYAAMGVARCVFALPSAGRDEVFPLVERYAEIAAAFG